MRIDDERLGWGREIDREADLGVGGSSVSVEVVRCSSFRDRRVTCRQA